MLNSRAFQFLALDTIHEAATNPRRTFAPPQPENAVSKNPNVRALMPIKAASKPAPKKTTAKKKATS
jgi:hypothetical protein